VLQQAVRNHFVLSCAQDVADRRICVSNRDVGIRPGRNGRWYPNARACQGRVARSPPDTCSSSQTAPYRIIAVDQACIGRSRRKDGSRRGMLVGGPAGAAHGVEPWMSDGHSVFGNDDAGAIACGQGGRRKWLPWPTSTFSPFVESRWMTGMNFASRYEAAGMTP